MNRITIIVLTLSLAACSACKHNPPAPPANPGVTVTNEGGKVTTTTKDPATGKMVTVISQATPPDIYPKDVPAFAEGNESIYTYSSEGGHITLQSFSSKATREVADYFEHELSGSGWTANVTTSQDKVSIVKADKAGRHVEINVTPVSTGSKVELSYNAAS